jgi:hypothetical protein
MNRSKSKYIELIESDFTWFELVWYDLTRWRLRWIERGNGNSQTWTTQLAIFSHKLCQMMSKSTIINSESLIENCESKIISISYYSWRFASVWWHFDVTRWEEGCRNWERSDHQIEIEIEIEIESAVETEIEFETEIHKANDPENWQRLSDDENHSLRIFVCSWNAFNITALSTLDSIN